MEKSSKAGMYLPLTLLHFSLTLYLRLEFIPPSGLGKSPSRFHTFPSASRQSTRTISHTNTSGPAHRPNVVMNTNDNLNPSTPKDMHAVSAVVRLSRSSRRRERRTPKARIEPVEPHGRIMSRRTWLRSGRNIRERA